MISLLFTSIDSKDFIQGGVTPLRDALKLKVDLSRRDITTQVIQGFVIQPPKPFLRLRGKGDHRGLRRNTPGLLQPPDHAMRGGRVQHQPNRHMWIGASVRNALYSSDCSSKRPARDKEVKCLVVALWSKRPVDLATD